jgi:hypothetical protein
MADRIQPVIYHDPRAGRVVADFGEAMQNKTPSPGANATSLDHTIIDATSVALDGRIGAEDDVKRLRQQISSSLDPLNTACEISVAFIRWAQDLKAERDELRKQVEQLAKACDVAHEALCRATFPGPRDQRDLNYAIDTVRKVINRKGA